MEPKQSLLIVMEFHFVGGTVHREPMMLFAKEDEAEAKMRAQAISQRLGQPAIRQAMGAMGMTEVGVAIQVVPFMDGSRIQVVQKVVLP